jgi:hypothetical protein
MKPEVRRALEVDHDEQLKRIAEENKRVKRIIRLRGRAS